MSSNFSAAFGAERLIDGSLSGGAITDAGRREWASVHVNTSRGPIGHIAVFNVRTTGDPTALGQFEVCVGSSYGDCEQVCGATSYAAASEPLPYILACDHASSSNASYATIVQSGDFDRFLSLAEIQVFLRSESPHPAPHTG